MAKERMNRIKFEAPSRQKVAEPRGVKTQRENIQILAPSAEYKQRLRLTALQAGYKNTKQFILAAIDEKIERFVSSTKGK